MQKSKSKRLGNLKFSEKSLCKVGTIENMASEEISAIKNKSKAQDFHPIMSQKQNKPTTRNHLHSKILTEAVIV